MRVRYLAALCWDPTRCRDIAGRMAALPALRMIFDSPPVLLFASRPGTPFGRQVMVVGSHFSRGGAAGPGETAGTGMLGADSLLEQAWGGYVAFVQPPDQRRVMVFRAPLGDLPCYWTRSGDVTLLGSDLSVLLAAGARRPSLNVAALARHMASEDLRLSETCLTGIRELRGGDRLAITRDGVSSTTLWSPWQFARSDRQITDPPAASNSLREAILHAVGSQASGYRRPLLKLSGGLDSSIVAAALARQEADFTCLNLVTEDPAGDERQYAHLVASHLGVGLVESFRRSFDVDLRHSAAARLPRPTARAFTQASASAVERAAADCSSEAVFDGGGGDNLFCSLQSARPASDCLLAPAGRQAYWSTVRSIGSLAEVGLGTVVARSLQICLRRSTAYPPPIDTRFLSPAARDEASGGARHPWLSPPPGTLPGKAAQVALLAAAQSVVESADVEDQLPAYSPLISQPVAEACLRIPTWLWFRGGMNRSMARSAFRRDLPARVIERRSKGAPDCFVAEIFQANRRLIRDLLLGGVLDRHGLLDRQAIEQGLADRGPVRGHDFLRLMHLVDVEAWASGWD